MFGQGDPTAAARSVALKYPWHRQPESRQQCAPVARGRPALARAQHPRLSAAQQRPWPFAEIAFGGEISDLTCASPREMRREGSRRKYCMVPARGRDVLEPSLIYGLEFPEFSLFSRAPGGRRI